MILVADSGSTKCDWIPVTQEAVSLDKISTMGFNPFFHSSEFIEHKIRESEALMLIADKIKKVFYYGAGCSSKEFNAIVRKGLSSVFKNAEINVDHDLSGAAYATSPNAPGISCILGTGSNSCYFDLEKIHEAVPALGYILGDEGSGSYFGRRLIRAYLYLDLPEAIHEAFEENFSKNKQIIFENVYMKPHANVYLASFMRFIASFRDDPFVYNMIREGFKEFLSIHVMKFKNYNEVPVHFVGSVAFYFQDVLKEVAGELGITIGNIVKQPVLNLVIFHHKDL